MQFRSSDVDSCKDNRIFKYGLLVCLLVGMICSQDNLILLIELLFVSIGAHVCTPGPDNRCAFHQIELLVRVKPVCV